MPDDITPEPTDDAPTGDPPGEAGASPSWDTATQAHPAATPAGDLTEAVPVDTTRSMAGITPPTGTPAAAAAGAGAGAAAGGAVVDGAGGGTRTSAQKAWIIAVVAAAVLVLGAGIALAATSGGAKNKNKAGAAAPNIFAPTTTAATGPLCPLTGLAPSGGAVPQRPALAVKVDNYPDARPQSGIDQADIVFDEPVEGGITRFAAVFQCQSPSLIGPIPSILPAPW